MGLESSLSKFFIFLLDNHSTVWGVPSFVIFCRAVLTCSAGCWTYTDVTVQPNWEPELPKVTKTKHHE